MDGGQALRSAASASAGVPAEVAWRQLPPWILIQSTGNGQDAPLPNNYQQFMRQSFGSGRSLAFWHLAGASQR